MPPIYNPAATSPRTLAMRRYRARLKAERPADWQDGRTKVGRWLKRCGQPNCNGDLVAARRAADRERKRLARGSRRTGTARHYKRAGATSTVSAEDLAHLQNSSGHSE